MANLRGGLKSCRTSLTSSWRGSKGRIIRKDGKFVDIVEAKDADEEIKKVKEVHAGYLCCYTRSIYALVCDIANFYLLPVLLQ